MKKKPRIKNAKKIDELIIKLRTYFGVQNYDCSIFIEEKKHDNPAGENCTAQIEVHDDYQRLYVYLYPAFFKASLVLQREYLLHEFAHTVTSDLLKCADDLRTGKLITSEQVRIASEKATSKISLMLRDTLLGEKDMRKAYTQFIHTAKKG